MVERTIGRDSLVIGAVLGIWRAIEWLSTAEYIEEKAPWVKSVVDLILPIVGHPLFAPALLVGGFVLLMRAGKQQNPTPEQRLADVTHAEPVASPAAAKEFVPHEMLSEEWLGDELRDLGFSEEDIGKCTSPCLANLNEHGIAFKDEAREFFDHVETRRLLERAYRSHLNRTQRRLDPDGYGFWGSAYFKATATDRPAVLASIKNRLRAMGFREGLEDIRVYGARLRQLIRLDEDTVDSALKNLKKVNAWRKTLKEHTDKYKRPEVFTRIDVIGSVMDRSYVGEKYSEAKNNLLIQLDERLERLAAVLSEPDRA